MNPTLRREIDRARMASVRCLAGAPVRALCSLRAKAGGSGAQQGCRLDPRKPTRSIDSILVRFEKQIALSQQFCWHQDVVVPPLAVQAKPTAPRLESMTAYHWESAAMRSRSPFRTFNNCRALLGYTMASGFRNVYVSPSSINPTTPLYNIGFLPFSIL